jgi:Kef-type K+ transport system membrane component KefB
VFERLEDTTAQIRVRAAVAIMVGFAALAGELGLETILGAFVAGALLRVVDKEELVRHPRFADKLEGIGYGFVIPVYFVTSGLRFDADALFASASTVARVPLFLLALLLVRGLPALLSRPGVDDQRAVAAAGLLQATSLPFIVAATQIGLEMGLVNEATPPPWSAPGCCRSSCSRPSRSACSGASATGARPPLPHAPLTGSEWIGLHRRSTAR